MFTAPPGGEFSPHSSQTGPRKVYRSHINRMIFGVCGGIGEYLGIDPTLIRVIWILSVFIAGSGILAYIIGAIIIPNEPGIKTTTTILPKENSNRIGVLIGVVLIFIGIIYLSNFFSWYREFPPFYFWHFRFHVFGPVIFIAIGTLLILMYFKKEIPGFPQFEGRTLHRSRTDRKLLGICGGLGVYFHIDPTLVRIFWVFFTIATGLIIGIVMYILCFILLQEEPVIHTQGSYSSDVKPPDNQVETKPPETGSSES